MMKSAIILAVALSTATVANAQPSTTPAERARAEAERLSVEGTKSALLRAARMYQRSAALSDGADPAAVNDLIMAGRLLHHADRNLAARSTMLDAAERALEIGQLVQAGEAYAYAAWLAERAGRADLVLDYAARAKKLADSPLLSTGQRTQILRHFSADVLAAI